MNFKIKVGGNDYCISRLEINECYLLVINVVFVLMGICNKC